MLLTSWSRSTWVSTEDSTLYLLQSHSNYKLNYPSQLRTRLMEDFKCIWDRERQQNRKLVFYNSIKSSFEPKKYIGTLKLYLHTILHDIHNHELNIHVLFSNYVSTSLDKETAISVLSYLLLLWCIENTVSVQNMIVEFAIYSSIENSFLEFHLFLYMIKFTCYTVPVSR